MKLVGVLTHQTPMVHYHREVQRDSRETVVDTQVSGELPHGYLWMGVTAPFADATETLTLAIAMIDATILRS